MLLYVAAAKTSAIKVTKRIAKRRVVGVLLKEEITCRITDSLAKMRNHSITSNLIAHQFSHCFIPDKK